MRPVANFYAINPTRLYMTKKCKDLTKKNSIIIIINAYKPMRVHQNSSSQRFLITYHKLI